MNYIMKIVMVIGFKVEFNVGKRDKEDSGRKTIK